MDLCNELVTVIDGIVQVRSLFIGRIFCRWGYQVVSRSRVDRIRSCLDLMPCTFSKELWERHFADVGLETAAF